MRRSTDSISNEPMITNNCPLYRHSPNVPGHTIENCPVIQQFGLRLQETSSQPNSSSRPVTGPPSPSPSPPTSPMRSPENSYEHGLISESIQRQVTTVERQ